MPKCNTINFMKKQTAVEWLFVQLTSTWYDTNSSQDIFKQAKAMEKEQLIKSHIDGFDHIVVDFKKQEYAEQYYNEIYTDGTI